MKESFYDALKRGDIDAARAIKKKQTPNADEVKRALLMVTTELQENVQLDALLFLQQETAVNLNARYFDNEETVQHMAAKRGDILIFVFLAVMGANLTVVDKAGNKTFEYFNKLEGMAAFCLIKTFPLVLKQFINLENKIEKINSEVSRILLFSAMEMSREDTLQRISPEELERCIKTIDTKFSLPHIIELLCHENYKAYKFIMARQFKTSDFPRFQVAMTQISARLNPEVPPQPQAQAVQPQTKQPQTKQLQTDWKSLYIFLKTGKWKDAEECFARAPLEPSVLTQLLFQCIDGFGDDAKLLNCVMFLSEKGADCSKRRQDYKSPLHLALVRNKLKTAEFLVSKIKEEDKRKVLSQLLLKIMVEIKNDAQLADLVVFLVKNGANANIARQTDLMTPMHILMRRDGATNKFPKTLKVLFDSKANMEARNCKGRTPQDCATEAVLNSMGREEYPGKPVTVMWGKTDHPAQKSPLEKMIDVLPEPKRGLVVESKKAVELLSELDDCEVQEIMDQLKYGEYKAYKLCAWKCMDYSQFAAVKEALLQTHKSHKAAWFRCCESVRLGKERVITGIEFLIKSGANVDWQEPETDKTMLHYAIEQQHDALIALLKSHNARMDIPAKPFGRTAKDLEAERNQPESNSVFGNAGPLQYGQSK